MALMTFDIGNIGHEDFDAWHVLWQGYNAFYGRSGVNQLPSRITAMTWARFFDEEAAINAIVARSEGRILGFAHYIFHPSTITMGPSCYLQDLFIDEASRGKGIGRALILEVYERARLAHADRVYWQTHETNRTAMKLYDSVAERTGFIVYRKPA